MATGWVGADVMAQPGLTARRRPVASSTRRRSLQLAPLLTFAGMATIGYSQFEVAGLPVSDYFFAMAAVVVLGNLLVNQTVGLAPPSIRRGSSLITMSGLIILTFGALSSLWSLNPIGSMAIVLRYGWLILGWFWLLRAVTPDREAFCRLVTGLKTAVAISSGAAIAGYLGLVNLGGGGEVNAEGREAGFYGHPNHLASLLVVGLPFFLLPMPDDEERSRSLTRRLALSGYVIFALATTGAMTGAFAAIVGLTTAGITYLLTRPSHSRGRRLSPLAMVSLVTVVALGLAALVQSDAPVVQRFTRWVEGDDNVAGSVDNRGEMNEFVIERLDERLVIGVGMDKESALPGIGISIHNMYLKLVHEAGLLALVGLVALLTISLRQAWALAINTRRGRLHGVSVALVSALVSAMVIGLFYPVAFQRQFWISLALISVLWSLRRHELANRSEN